MNLAGEEHLSFCYLYDYNHPAAYGNADRTGKGGYILVVPSYSIANVIGSIIE